MIMGSIYSFLNVYTTSFLVPCVHVSFTLKCNKNYNRHQPIRNKEDDLLLFKICLGEYIFPIFPIKILLFVTIIGVIGFPHWKILQKDFLVLNFLVLLFSTKYFYEVCCKCAFLSLSLL